MDWGAGGGDKSNRWEARPSNSPSRLHPIPPPNSQPSSTRGWCDGGQDIWDGCYIRGREQAGRPLWALPSRLPCRWYWWWFYCSQCMMAGRQADRHAIIPDRQTDRQSSIPMLRRPVLGKQPSPAQPSQVVRGWVILSVRPVGEGGGCADWQKTINRSIALPKKKSQSSPVSHASSPLRGIPSKQPELTCRPAGPSHPLAPRAPKV